MTATRFWDTYYAVKEDTPPSRFLVKAVSLVQRHEFALDLGAGPLNDSKYLLEQGFDVTAVDNSPLMLKAAQKVHSSKFHPIQSRMEDFKFPAKKYGLVNAAWALPFIEPESFKRVFQDMESSLTGGGVFVGQLFGENDEWAANPRMTFVSRGRVELLLDDMEVIECKEYEGDRATAIGEQKHWHVFHIIARER